MDENREGFNIQNEKDLINFIESLNEELSEFDEDSDIGEIYEHVAFANYVFQNTTDIMYSVEFGSISGSRSNRLKNRLQNWINNLQNTVSQMAQNQNADSFSISASTPWSIGVSVTYDI